MKSYADTWLATAPRRQRPNAYAADASTMKDWIVPTIGRRRLDSLTPDDIRKVIAAQLDAGKAPSTALRTHRVLIKMLKDATLDGHDVPQRVLLVPAPSAGSSDRDAITVAHAVAILGRAADLPHGSRWATALLQGMRPGECLGLTWSMVDFDKRRHHRRVAAAATPLPRQEATAPAGSACPTATRRSSWSARCHLVRPKSRAGWRVIPMVPWIRAALLAWREHQVVTECPTPRALSGLPSTAARSPTRHRPGGVAGPTGRRALDRWSAAERAGRSVGLGHPAGRYYVPHEARHTAATLLLEAGTDPGVVTAILGHSSILTSRGYQHVGVKAAAAALEQMATQLQLGA